MFAYRDINSGQVVRSDEPRPDLLEWAYWEQITEAAVPEPVEAQPEPDATPAVKPVRKPRTPKAAEGE